MEQTAEGSWVELGFRQEKHRKTRSARSLSVRPYPALLHEMTHNHRGGCKSDAACLYFGEILKPLEKVNAKWIRIPPRLQIRRLRGASGKQKQRYKRK